MTRAITPAAFAVPPSPLSALAGPDIEKTGPLAKAGVSGPARPIKPTSKRAGAVQLLVLRELLAAEAKHLLTQRRCKAASDCEAELMRLNHLILRAGVARQDAAGRAKEA